MKGSLLVAYVTLLGGVADGLFGQLPPPENLRADFTADSLTLVADEVAGATGYRFAVDRLDGCPLTERRADFADAPELAEGWSYGGQTGVVLGKYIGTGYYDSRTSADKSALKIEVRGSAGSRVEILSPSVPARVSEYSFSCRAASAASSDTVAVYGRSGETEPWQALTAAVHLPGSMTGMTNAVPKDADVRQLLFVVEATGQNAANAALDSLRIVYGGEVVRTAVLSGDAVSVRPICELAGLVANGRYAFRAQAVADDASDSPCRDSAWTDEQVVDLSWSSIRVLPPERVESDVRGGKIVVRWSVAAQADHYLVDVIPLGDPEHPVVRAAKTNVTSIEVEVPSVGEYVVTVTAVSPGGISMASSAACVCEVGIGPVVSVALKATAPRAVEASWTKVSFAEGYLVRLFSVGDAVGMQKEVESVRTTETKLAFRDLDPNGRYAVTVVPLPGEDDGLGAVSPTVDLSAAHFRRTGAVPVSRVRGGAYVETFDSLSSVVGKVETASLPLDYWQLEKGNVEAGEVLYSSKTNFTNGGIYVFCDERRTPSSFMLGTLATGTYGCTVGIAFTNDTDGTVGVGTLSFDAVQRTFRKVPRSYELEWLLTSGATGIETAGDWRRLEMPVTAPYVAGDPEADGDYRRTVVIGEGLPKRMQSGNVLILRWRHEKVASGPAMAIDSVRLGIDKAGRGFCVMVK